MPGWVIPRNDGVLLVLRVVPNAGRDVIEGIEQRADASTALKVRVTAPPDKGRANAAVIALLAARLGLPRSTMRLHRGETSRSKVVLVMGDPETITPLLAKLGE